MGYETKKRHTDAQSANIKSQAKRVWGATGIRGKFLRNLLLSSDLDSSQANDYVGLAKQLAH
jgi:hypothetical protein